VNEKLYSSDVYELMARCLSNEASEADVKKLELLLVNDESLRADLESMRLLVYKEKNGEGGDEYTHDRFARLSKRLKEEGLI